MKLLSALILPLSILISCNPPAEYVEETHEANISNIENALQPMLQINGEEVPTFNIADRMRHYKVEAVSLAVVIDGQLAWARAYGTADRELSKAVNTETLFLAGSVSKPVAALGALQMAEQGVFGLDDNVNDHLTSWQVPDNEFTETEKVSIRRILNHTAGLTVWGFPGYDKGDTVPTTVQVLDGEGNTDPIRVYKEPGESWGYSGGGYTIMQLMMRDKEGKEFAALMQERVLDPIGMTASTYANPLPEEFHAIAATGYRDNGDEVEGKWPIYPEMAAAGLWTTPSQLAKYIIAVNETHDGTRGDIISTDLASDMLTPGMNNHGLGPVISGDSLRWGHGGADEGFRTQLTSWFEGNHGIVIMVNSDNGAIMRELLRAIANEYGWPGIEPTVKEVISLSEEVGAELAGSWDLGEVGVVNVEYKDGQLITTADFIDTPMTFAAENDSLFFHLDGGMQMRFTRTSGELQMKVQGLTGTKLE